jgi:hypothetical protein
MSYENNMDKFFDWLAKPMKDEDVIAWYLANNITIELTNLFRDFIISFLDLLKDTYLGDDTNTDSNLTKVGMTVEQKKDHFNWCWEKIVENFKKENINFKFEKVDYEFFQTFLFDLFYSNEDKKVKNSIDDFFVKLFDRNHKKTKSDIEIFTDLYKTLERSLNV